MGKISEQDLKKINDLKQETVETAYSLGELEYQKTSLELLIDEVKSKIKVIKVKEAQLFTELKNTYGNVNINIETGEF